MRRNEQDQFAGVGVGRLVAGGSLKSGELAQSRVSSDAGCFAFGETACHERSLAVVECHVGDELLVIEDRDIA